LMKGASVIGWGGAVAGAGLANDSMVCILSFFCKPVPIWFVQVQWW
jgi:hypothetical protein